MIVPRLYEDLSVLHQNTMPDRAYYVPSSTRGDRLAWHRESSDRLQMLSGCEWRFAWYPSIHDLQDHFYLPDYEPGKWWKKEMVPFCWQMRGYDSPQYTNIRYPFPFDPPYVPQDNPCGAYLHHFEWHRDPKAPCAFLNFEGVDSCFYVWLNGTYVGYSQIAHHTSEFDVTELLREGDNLLAVLVLKWCDGSYLEDQDKFRFSGIFRDVYLLHRPADRIEDYVIETDLSDDYMRADLNIRFTFSRKPLPVSLTLISPDGSGILYQDTIRPGREGNRDEANGAPTECVTIEVDRPLLWNAEDPVLYTLVIDTRKEVITEKVGFRKVEVKDLVLTLNGAPITFRGVNRHESDPLTGAVCSLDQALKDLRMIKANNFNAVRASHYPNSPWFYQLCDELGLYVIDEADNESHGTGPLTFGEEDYTERMRKAHFRIADNPDFVEPTLDRIRSMVIRNRNRPSILVWSMGNECGYGRTFEEALRWTKENDPTRLTHYESAFYVSPVREFDVSNIDLYGRMYPGFNEVTDYLDNDPDIPLLLVEYCHSMGNGPGDFKEYLDLTEQYPALCGGFVWEWCDHAVYKGTTENGKAMYWYGGDHGELQHDGNFCLDGLVYPDRTPHTGLLEYKNVHRPLRAAYDAGRQILTVENHMDFTDPAEKISAAWILTLDGSQIAEGPLAIPSIAPHACAEIPLAFTVPDKGRCFLTVTYVLKKETFGLPAGHELGFDEIRISNAEPRALKAAGLLAGTDRIRQDAGKMQAGAESTQAGPQSRQAGAASAQTGTADGQTGAAGARTAADPQTTAMAAPAVTETDRFLIIEGEGFTYKLDSLSGLFTSLKVHDRELLDRPIDFNLWRAPTDNDVPGVDLWKLERLDHTGTRAYEVTWKTAKPADAAAGREADGSEAPEAVEISIRQSVASMSNQPVLRMNNKVTVFADGRILLDVQADKDPEYADLPRIGLRLFLSGSMKKIRYFGMGPMETYIDKHHAGHHGIFKGTAASMQEDYIRPQESGSHYDCDFVTVKGKGLCLTAASADTDPDSTFSFNASVYTQEELEEKRHNYELEPCGSTVLCIDHRMAGIGSHSCGPELLPKYRVSADTFRFSFMLKPEEI